MGNALKINFKRIAKARPSSLWWHARKHRVGRWVFFLLSQPIIGYPLEKFFQTISQIQSVLLRSLNWFSARLPYTISVKSKDLLDPRLIGVANSPFIAFMRYLRQLESVSRNLAHQPKFSVILPVHKVNLEYLKEAIDSVIYQVYPNWELCVVDDFSQDQSITTLLIKYQQELGAEKFKLSALSENRHISTSSNSAVELASGDYLVFLDHDDRLYPNALAEVARHINRFKNPEILYSDERTITDEGEQLASPFYKPDFSRHLLNSVNFICHLLVVRTDLFRGVGGFRSGYEGAQDHDLILRLIDQYKCKPVHIPMCLYEWRAVSQSTSAGIEAKPYAVQAGIKCIKDSLDRSGRKATVEVDSVTKHYRIKYQIGDPKPLVSILIPSRDNYLCLSRCLQAIFEKTRYPFFEVLLLDNETVEKKTLELISSYEKKHQDRFRRLHCPGQFNFNAFNNYGASKASGDYLVFLNNDTEVINDSWLEELLSLAQWPEVGAVGAKLLYEDQTIQHGGVLLLGKAIAGHAYLGATDTSPTPASFINTVHEVSAVTAACLMVAKEKFKTVGGLDEVWLPNGWGDVDFCLKLRASGFVNLFNPYAKLFHFESKTRGFYYERFEMIEMMRRHGDILLQDPYLNPNFQFTSSYDLDARYSAADPDAQTISYLLKNSLSIMTNDWSKLTHTKNKVRKPNFLFRGTPC